MADRGFSGYASDFATTLKENGEDIIVVTQEIEKLFTDTLDYLTDDSKLDAMVSQIRAALESLAGKLEAGDIFTVEKMEKQFDGIIDQINNSTGIDLENSLDPGKVLQSISDLIPEDVFPEELKQMYQKIKAFFETVDLSDVRLSIKSVTEPVPKPSAAAGTGQGIDALRLDGMPSNFDMFDATASTLRTSAPSSTSTPSSNEAAEVESLLEELFKQLSNTFLDKQSLIDGFLKKMEEAVVASGFYNELEEKREAFINSLTSGKFSAKKLFRSLAKLIVDLIASAVQALSMILEVIIDDFKALMQAIRGLLTIKPGALVGALLEQFGIQDFNPSILSLPAFLISVPYTLVTKAVTGKRPTFPSILQDDTTDTNNKVYGSVQIVKSILPLFGLAADKLDTNHRRWALLAGAAGDFIGPSLDVVGQAYSEPLHPKRPQHYGYSIWNYQWFFNVGIGYLTALFNLIYGLNDLRDKTWKDRHRKLVLAKNIILPFSQVVFELIHLGMFSYLYHLEVEAEKTAETTDDPVPINDIRTRNGYMLDPFPGIVGGVLDISLVFIDLQLEGLKDTIQSRVIFLDGIIKDHLALLNDTTALTNFFGPLNDLTKYGDLEGYQGLIDQITPVVEGIEKMVKKFLATNNHNETQKARAEAVLKNIEGFLNTLRKMPWNQLITHHKESKAMILKFRQNALNMMGRVQANLKSLNQALETDDTKSVQDQIKIHKNFQPDIIRFFNEYNKWEKKLTSQVIIDNTLLSSLFYSDPSLLTKSKELQNMLKELIDGLTNHPELNSQNQLLKDLNAVVVTLTKKEQRVKKALPRYISSSESGTIGDFPTSPELWKLEKAFQILKNNANFITNLNVNQGSNDKKIRNLETAKNVLTGVNIFNTLAFQLTYGSLYVNTGVIPNP